MFSDQQIEFIHRDLDGRKLEHIKGNVTKVIPRLLLYLEHKVGAKIQQGSFTAKLEEKLDNFTADMVKDLEKLRKRLNK